MDPKLFMQDAAALQPLLQTVRRDLHMHPELGFDMAYTKPYLKAELEKMGYEVREMGKAGLVVEVGPKDGKMVLLRGDMDALPLDEEVDVEYKSQNPGKMHACGHDMHATMVLGAAKLLKDKEAELKGRVRLEFQPAEEIFQGSSDMIAAGLLEGVDAAMMIHCAPGVDVPKGLALVAHGPLSMASCEQYHITVKGKGGHGSTPHLAIDPITAAAHIHLALQEINSRELNANDFGVFTTCHFQAGKTSNVIPETAEMWGTIRTTDPTEQIGNYIKERMKAIVEGVGASLRCEASVEFFDYCPCMQVDMELAKKAYGYSQEIIGPLAQDFNTPPQNSSEDFAFVSREVPTVEIFLATGGPKEGCSYPVHNPKSKFDDSVLAEGAALYAWFAVRYLEEHS